MDLTTDFKTTLEISDVISGSRRADDALLCCRRAPAVASALCCSGCDVAVVPVFCRTCSFTVGSSLVVSCFSLDRVLRSSILLSAATYSSNEAGDAAVRGTCGGSDMTENPTSTGVLHRTISLGSFSVFSLRRLSPVCDASTALTTLTVCIDGLAPANVTGARCDAGERSTDVLDESISLVVATVPNS